MVDPAPIPSAPIPPVSPISEKHSSSFSRYSLFVSIIVGLLIIIGASWTYFTWQAPVQPKLYSGKITIGTVSWVGYKGLFIARDKGFFKTHGLDVDIKNYESLSDLSSDYTKGLIQGRANLNFDTVLEAMHGFDHRIVLVIDYSSGADAIIAKKGINSFADLKGKKVAYNAGTVEEYFLSYALKDFGMTVSDVVGVNAYAESTVGLVNDKSVDAAVTFEPFLSGLVADGSYYPLITSKEAPGLISDLLTFNSEFIDSNPETVQAIVNAYFEALEWSKANEEEAVSILAKEFKGKPEDIKEQLKGLLVLDRAENAEAFQTGEHSLSLNSHIGNVIQFVRTYEKNTTSTLQPDMIIDSQFVIPSGK